MIVFAPPPLENSAISSGSPATPAHDFPAVYPEGNLLETNAALKEWLPVALESARAAVPRPLELLGQTFGFTDKKLEDLEAGVPVLRLQTPEGDYLAYYDEYRFEHGILRTQQTAGGNYRSRPLQVRNPVVAFFAKEIGKALLKEVGAQVYNYFWPSDKDAVLKDELGKLREDMKAIVKEVVQDTLREYKFESFEDEFIDTHHWLKTTFTSHMASYYEGKGVLTTELRDLLQRRQTLMQSLVTRLEARMPDHELAACSYVTRLKVMLYAACVCMRIVLMKEQLLLERLLMEQKKNEYNIHGLLDELTEFRNHSANIIELYRDRLDSGRLAQIGAVEVFNRQYTKTSWWFGTESYYGTAGYEWTDRFASKHKGDPYLGDVVHYELFYVKDDRRYEKGPTKETANRFRDEHINDVRILSEKYVTRPLTEIVNALRNAPLELSAKELLTERAKLPNIPSDAKR